MSCYINGWGKMSEVGTGMMSIIPGHPSKSAQPMVMIGTKQITFSLYLGCPSVGPYYPLSYATHKSPPMRSPRGSSPQPTTSLSLTFPFLLLSHPVPCHSSNFYLNQNKTHYFISFFLLSHAHRPRVPPKRSSSFTTLLKSSHNASNYSLFSFFNFLLLLLLWGWSYESEEIERWEIEETSAIGIHVERKWRKRGRKNLPPTHTHMNQHASALHVPQYLTSLLSSLPLFTIFTIKLCYTFLHFTYIFFKINSNFLQHFINIQYLTFQNQNPFGNVPKYNLMYKTFNTPTHLINFLHKDFFMRSHPSHN